MAPSRRSVSLRLGDAATRRRRHRRVVALAVGLLALSAALIYVVDDRAGGDGFRDRANATCATFRDRVQREFELSFPEGVPTPAAEAEYLSRAFADTMDDLVAALRRLEPDGRAAEAVDGLADRIAEIRADPAPFAAAAANPFAGGVAPRFDDLDIEACGSEFFGAGS